MTFLDKTIVAPALISMKKNSAVLWHSSFDKCNYFLINQLLLNFLAVTVESLRAHYISEEES